MTQDEIRRVENLRDLLDEGVTAALGKLLGRIDENSPGDLAIYLQIAMEVFSHHLGYTDAYASLGNVPKDVRERLMRRAFRDGQETRVREHDHDCVEGRACEDVLRLLNEMYPN